MIMRRIRGVDLMGLMTYEQEEYTCVVRKLMLSVKCDNETQRRHKPFRIRCTMKWSLCDFIIDSGSQENVINKDVA